jgi:cytoskeletal protein RodZ
MATGKVFSIIAASLVLLLASSLSPVLGFGPFIINSPSQQQQQKSQSRCQIPTISTPTAASRSFTIRMSMMTNNDDEESSSSDSSNKAAEDHDNTSKSSNISEATAGGGTIAISSAKSAADAAKQSTTTTTNTAATSNKSKSPSKTGFSLILLPTLLLKFTIVLIVKFATDVVVYPLLYLYRWGRMGKKKIVRSVGRLFGKGSGEEEEGINGVKVNGDSA